MRLPNQVDDSAYKYAGLTSRLLLHNEYRLLHIFDLVRKILQTASQNFSL
jgi:hypothetical protein